jgi:hypothetical protein
MKALEYAIVTHRYDLAAHVLVLYALKALKKNGGSPRVREKTPQLLLKRSR